MALTGTLLDTVPSSLPVHARQAPGPSGGSACRLAVRPNLSLVAAKSAAAAPQVDTRSVADPLARGPTMLTINTCPPGSEGAVHGEVAPLPRDRDTGPVGACTTAFPHSTTILGSSPLAGPNPFPHTAQRAPWAGRKKDSKNRASNAGRTEVGDPLPFIISACEKKCKTKPTQSKPTSLAYNQGTCNNNGPGDKRENTRGKKL